jgi:hypothetical protein
MGSAAPVVGLAALICLVLAGCGRGDRGTDPSNAATARGDALVNRCLDFPEDQDDEVETLPFVDCGEPHTHEIYWAGPYQPTAEGESASSTAGPTTTLSDVYPGQQALEAFAEKRCVAEFYDYVGVDVVDTDLYYSWMIPSLDGWNDDGVKDRTIICLVSFPNAAQQRTTGTIGTTVVTTSTTP